MPAGDSKHAEKQYLRRGAGGTWERWKPFSPPGTDTVAESARVIHDFSVALQTLRPTPLDLILDVGAGACWCSDWLQRLNLHTVSVDISLDMLRVGQSRLDRRSPPRLVAGDMEHLPFAASSFEKAVCLNALHHAADFEAAVREIGRVLKPGGMALFSEPGVGHADKPWSISAMQDFGVLERDVVIASFMEICLEVGFAAVRLKPISYVVPEFDLELEHWNQWQRFWRRKRPQRAAHTIWRGVLELFGASKTDLLLEEVFAVNMIRLLKQPVEEHPIFVAYKAPVTRWQPPVFKAKIEVADAPQRVRVEAPVRIRLRIRNTGNQSWPRSITKEGYATVRAGVQLLGSDRKLLNRDFHRADLPQSLSPGDEIQVETVCVAPSAPGHYVLKFDLVMESVAWFEPTGSETAVHELVVHDGL